MFPDRATPDENGEYRWRYDQKAHCNIDMLVAWARIPFAVTVPMGIYLLLNLWPSGPWRALLWGLTVGVGFELVMLLVYAIFPPSIAFRLANDEIEIWPKPRRSDNIFKLKDVRRITLRPERDLILLKFLLTSERVYVAREDFELVAGLLRERTPQGTEYFR